MFRRSLGALNDDPPVGFRGSSAQLIARSLASARQLLVRIRLAGRIRGTRWSVFNEHSIDSQFCLALLSDLSTEALRVAAPRW